MKRILNYFLLEEEKSYKVKWVFYGSLILPLVFYVFIEFSLKVSLFSWDFNFLDFMSFSKEGEGKAFYSKYNEIFTINQIKNLSFLFDLVSYISFFMLVGFLIGNYSELKKKKESKNIENTIKNDSRIKEVLFLLYLCPEFLFAIFIAFGFAVWIINYKFFYGGIFIHYVISILVANITIFNIIR